ncbi:MAG TPA: phosphoribosylanthranilate isomerase [Acidimicrobiales bacterium]|nr:phosphoribosylanthranilate isomerase [Acidimicrobiales bacterium]HVA54028.1 phosphoribosylanthranilate isomerase [Acidimicrobiales bacterium]
MPSVFERGFVKVCGVTNVDDAATAAAAGANAIGLILADSPRRVTLEQAIGIAAAVKGDVLRCAIFRDEDDDVVIETLDALDVDVVQVHGALSSALLAALRQRSLLVIKALNVEGDDFATFDASLVDAVLIDGPRPGSGVTHSWERLHDRRFRAPVIAAGGLDPNNVADVINTTNAWGVDCASGVERTPRLKDHDLVRRYVANARDAFSRQGVP